MGNEPFMVTEDMIFDAMIAADKVGEYYKKTKRDC